MKKRKYNSKDIDYSVDNSSLWEEDQYDERYDDVDDSDEDSDDEYAEEEEDEDDLWGEREQSKKSVVIVEDVKADVESIDNKPKKRGPKPQKTEFYVEPKEFDDHIIKYYDSGNLTDALATMISKIAHKLSYAPNFINYTYREEMVGDAIVRMMKALTAKKYCHIKGKNPFSYFTKIAFNAFRNRIKREKHMHETLQKYRDSVIFAEMQPNNFKNKNGLEKFAAQED